ncbi:MAG: S-methyl-5'-thioadenosine phosphorylase [Candidatus Marinimicrobia bacterium]|nr:S-methyl-5'-thioadenosine phosphorylase [Candidatus Neomarinimicrobiota bacterium]
MNAKLAIIGGTGFYDFEGLEIKDSVAVETPYGNPSDEFVIGELEGKEVVFLPRHGKGHRIMPSRINYRANIYGLKKLGVTHIVSVSAVGSFKEEIEPGSLVIVDQFFDRTKNNVNNTFFDEGVAVHVAFSDPVCPVMFEALVEIAKRLGLKAKYGGTYLNMEGPAFSTRAESRIYKSWGVDVIGMTNMYEARLSREAEIHFATIAQVTDYDSWKEEFVDVPTVLENLKKSVFASKSLLEEFIKQFPPQGDCTCEKALETAIVTDLNILDERLRSKYWVLLKKYMK